MRFKYLHFAYSCMIRRLYESIQRTLSGTWRAGALALASLASVVATSGAENNDALQPLRVYLHQRILDNRGRETRDLYANQTYTNEVRVAIPRQLSREESIAGLRFTLRASSNVRTFPTVQERPSYGTNDIFWGKRLSENTVRHFGGESVRTLDITSGSTGIVLGTNVVAQYGFRVDTPVQYALTDFIVEGAWVKHPNGKESKSLGRNLKAVSVSQTYSAPVTVVERVNGNDHTYPNGEGIEFYFSVRNQRVFLEMSSDLERWSVLYSNLETCPSFTLKAIDLQTDSLQFFRIRPGNSSAKP